MGEDLGTTGAVGAQRSEARDKGSLAARNGKIGVPGRVRSGKRYANRTGRNYSINRYWPIARLPEASRSRYLRYCSGVLDRIIAQIGGRAGTVEDLDEVVLVGSGEVPAAAVDLRDQRLGDGWAAAREGLRAETSLTVSTAPVMNHRKKLGRLSWGAERCWRVVTIAFTTAIVPHEDWEKLCISLSTFKDFSTPAQSVHEQVSAGGPSTDSGMELSEAASPLATELKRSRATRFDG